LPAALLPALEQVVHVRLSKDRQPETCCPKVLPGRLPEFGRVNGQAFTFGDLGGALQAPINGAQRVCFSRTMYIDEALGTTFIKTS
jgi:hypothetical protein